MSNKVNSLNKAIYGIMRNPLVRNPDLFNMDNAVKPSRRFYAEKMRWWFQKLGFEDYHIPVFMMFPLTIIAIYQVTAFYFLYGEKPYLSSNGLYRSYHAIPFFFSAKSNPDSHYSSLGGKYTNDRLYGLRALPKRPWEKFKDPENTMKRVAYKHNRPETSL